jgi:hypothetical protein
LRVAPLSVPDILKYFGGGDTGVSCYKVERDYSSPAYTGRTNTCLSSLSVLLLCGAHSFYFIIGILMFSKKPILKLLPRKS